MVPVKQIDGTARRDVVNVFDSRWMTRLEVESPGGLSRCERH